MPNLITGLLIAIALIAGCYTWQAGLVLLALAFVCHRFIQGDPIIGDAAFQKGLRASEMEVLSETETELVVRGSERALILDRSRRTISGIDDALAEFDDIQQIRIAAHSDSDTQEAFGRYSVTLKRKRSTGIRLGCTDDQLDASIVAAKLSTWLEVPVVTA